MGGRVFRRPVRGLLVSAAAPILFTLVIIALVLFGLTGADESSREEGVRILEEALFRAAIHSYAVEGHFPQSLDYITERYGIYIDRTRFIVHYEVFASNILPDIIVFEYIR